MIWSRYLAAAISFAATAGLLPLVRVYCIRRGLFDAPGPLKIHSQPTPRLGGTALFLGISAAMIAASPQRALASWPFFVGLTLVWLAGLIDDLRSLSPALRLAAQFSAGLFLWIGGWRIPFGSGATSALLNAALVAGLANAVNLLDGMDALATGVCLIMAAAYLTLPPASVSVFARTVASCVVAACLAFLPANWPIAAQFLGDCGSNLLGFLIAFLAIDFYGLRPATPSAMAFPFLVAALPFADAAFAALRRLRAGQSPWFGDRAHLTDRLRDRDWPVPRVVVSLYALTAVFAVIGLYGVRTQSALFWFAAIVAISLFVGAAIQLGSLRYKPTERPIDTPVGRLAKPEKEERLTAARYGR